MQTDKNDPKQMTRHHRKPIARGGTNESKNISFISREKHQAWHLLFNHMGAEEIARTMNTFYLDSDYEMVAIKKSLKTQ